MKQLNSFAVMFLLAGSAFGGAIPVCSTNTLSAYEAKGFECSQDGLLFSNFTFSSESFGAAAGISGPGAVTVVPLGTGFQFLANFRAGALNAGVHSGNPTPSGWQLTSIGYVERGTITSATVSWGPESNAPYQDSSDYSNPFWEVSGPGGLLYATDSSSTLPTLTTFFPAISAEDVELTIFLSAGVGDEALLYNGVSTAPNPQDISAISFSVPEPSSVLLFLPGLICLFEWKQFRRTGGPLKPALA